MVEKKAIGKLYEKMLIVKRNGSNIVTCSAMNTENGRREFILAYKDDSTLVPIAQLLTNKDMDMLVFESRDSAIVETLFSKYESADDRQTVSEFNGYYEGDESYDKMLDLLDDLRDSRNE